LNTLQQLYDSELNFELSCFWDGGFNWKLGDQLNGFFAKGHADTCEQAVQALARAACEVFPLSKFAQDRRHIA
jgi:hypothetical protein